MTWLIDTLIATTALIALVLAVRRPVARWFGPQLAYALWALPVLRLILPPIVLPAAQSAAAASTATVTTLDLAPATQLALAAEPAPVWSAIAPALQSVWLAGVLVFLAWRVWSYRAMRRRLLAGARQVGEAGTVRLVESAAVPSPVAFGVIDKVVALPTGFMDWSDREGRDLAIAHELQHHAGRDILANFAMQPLLALHWFNPLAWAAWRAMRRDQEAACDARVVAGRDAPLRARYGSLIASFAAAPRAALAAPLACPVVGEKSIVFRLRSLTMNDTSPNRRRIGRLLLAGGVLALPLSATISHAAPEPAPAAPAAPAEGAMKRQTRIMVIDNPAGSTIDDPSLHTRVVEVKGRTVVLKTKEPLSDKDAQARAERALAELDTMALEGPAAHVVHLDHAGAPPMPPMPPAAPGHHGPRVMVITAAPGAPGAPAAPAMPGEPGHHTSMVMVRHSGDGAPPADLAMLDGKAVQCSNGKPVTAMVERQNGDVREVSRVVVCTANASGGAPSIEGLRKARAKVAADTHLSPETKAEMLRQIDAEIARLEKQG